MRSQQEPNRKQAAAVAHYNETSRKPARERKEAAEARDRAVNEARRLEAMRQGQDPPKLLSRRQCRRVKPLK